MSATDITKEVVWEDAGAICLARVVGVDGANITHSDVTSIARKIFDLDSSTPTTAVDTSTLTVADTVYDTLQTDDRWSKDDTGYNFLDTVAASVLTTGDHSYLVEYKVTPVAGEVYWLVYQLYARNVLSS